MLRQICVLAIVMLALCSGSVEVAAQAPGTMIYQGRLADADGAPLSGSLSDVAFSIYAALEGGTALWTETHSITLDEQGVFTVELGTTTPFGPTVFDGTKRYLGIKVGTDNEMTPRQVLTSAPYSINTGHIADGSVTSVKIASNAVTGSKVQNGSLSRADILDEPGIANANYSSSFFYIAESGSTYVVDSVEITIPSAGYIEVTCMASWINIDHTTGSSTELWVGPSKARGTLSLTYGVTVLRIPFNQATTGSWAFPLTSHVLYSESAGTHKYYFHIYYLTGADVSMTVGRPYIRARFFPTLYGTLSLAGPTPIAGGAELARSLTDGSRQDVNPRIRTVTSDGQAGGPPVGVDVVTSDLEERIARLEEQLRQLKQQATKQ